MVGSAVLDSVRQLSDLEIATLLCLVTKQHGAISTDAAGLDDLEAELRLVTTNVFGLEVNAVRCNAQIEAQPFLNQLIKLPSRSRDPVPRLANVILVRDLHLASKTVQVQVLELIRNRQLLSKDATILAPDDFLILSLIPEGARLHDLLTDYIAIAHRHEPSDGFPNLEEASDPYYDLASPSSPDPNQQQQHAYIPATPSSPITPAFPPSYIPHLAASAASTVLTAPVRAYLQHIVVFLRLHRAVAPAGGGVSPKATRQFEAVARALAALHGIEYVTPDLVKLAARKVYRHRIRIAAPEAERSTQWGTEVGVAARWLVGWDTERVVEDVLDTVDCPP